MSSGSSQLTEANTSLIVLEGANPSAEGEDADDGGDGGAVTTVLDIEDQFRLNKIEGKPSKKAFQGEIKSQCFSSAASLEVPIVDRELVQSTAKRFSTG